MRILIAYLILSASLVLAQTSIIDVSTPPAIRCVATFQPATAATDVKVDCYISGVMVRTSITKIAVLTGLPNGVNDTIATGGNTVSILIQRVSSSAQLSIQATVNAGTPVISNVAVP